MEHQNSCHRACKQQYLVTKSTLVLKTKRVERMLHPNDRVSPLLYSAKICVAVGRLLCLCSQARRLGTAKRRGENKHKIKGKNYIFYQMNENKSNVSYLYLLQADESSKICCTTYIRHM